MDRVVGKWECKFNRATLESILKLKIPHPMAQQFLFEPYILENNHTCTQVDIVKDFNCRNVCFYEKLEPTVSFNREMDK